MGLGKVVELHSQAKQALVWNTATVVCFYEFGKVNWYVQEQREFMYFVSSDYRLAANGHTMLNAWLFYDVELQGTSMPDERHFQYKEVSQKWRLWFQAGQNKKDGYNNGIYISCFA